MSKTAFITGITGQDGHYLAELLLGKGYAVHGLVRYDAHMGTQGLENVTLHYGDVTDANNVNHLIKTIQPDEIYNLAALSHVKVSFETPVSTMEINAIGALNIFEAVRLLGLERRARLYQASSSEMFGSSPAPQCEETRMDPLSPYAVAKLAAYNLARVYRDSYGLYIVNGICFNHESPQRGEHFVTRKITQAVAEIEAGRPTPLALGNLNSVRDWGFAGDYAEGMWRALQQAEADDYVFATGQSRSVREFTERAFAQIGAQIEWRGEGLNEVGVCKKTGRTMVVVDEAFFRPLEVNCLIGDASKALAKLGWRANVSFDELVGIMVNADRAALRSGETTWAHLGQMAG